MEKINLLTVFGTGAGGSAIVFFILWFIFKTSFEAKLKSELQKENSKLIEEQNQKIESLKADFNKGVFRHEIQFKYEYEIYKELNERIDTIYINLKIYGYPQKIVELGKTINYFEKNFDIKHPHELAKYISDTGNFCARRCAFFKIELFKEITDFLYICNDFLSNFTLINNKNFVKLNFNEDEFYIKDLESFVINAGNKTNNIYDLIQKRIFQ